MSAMFSIESANISYDKKVITNLSLSVSSGEFCALLGLNGSGKTTVLRGCCGFIKMSGKCTFADYDLLRLNEKKRSRFISFIPQRYTVVEGISALEYVLMGYNPVLKVLQFPSKEQKQFALNVMNKLNCGQFAEKDFSKLSQGEQQIIILARSVVQNTPVMLMDEPDSALDFVNRHIILEKIGKLIHEENKAGLISLHDPNFAMKYCDRLLLLKDGKIVNEINMHNTSSEELEEKLSVLYGKISIYENNRCFYMAKK